MHISKLTHRTQILLDEDRYKRLRQRAEKDHRSLGALIREAIDFYFPPFAKEERVAKAAEALLNTEPMPVDDWPVLKREILSTYEKHLYPEEPDSSNDQS